MRPRLEVQNKNKNLKKLEVCLITMKKEHVVCKWVGWKKCKKLWKADNNVDNRIYDQRLSSTFQNFGNATKGTQ